MDLDHDVCYCYHVSLRKLINFSRRERPQVPSRMTECLGAGTGCGWCIPFLVKISRDPDAFPRESIDVEQYAQQRQGYIKSGQPRNTFEK